MSRVTIKDKTFEVSITEEEIQQRVRAVADRINHDLQGKNPIFLAVLNGSFVFAADLVRCITIPSEVSFVRLQSYEATESTGVVKEVIGLSADIKGRNIVIVEDIVDTGESIEYMICDLKAQKPASLEVCTLFFKPGSYRKQIPIKYRAMEIGNEFIVGYGLDYDQLGRNYKDVYVVTE